MSNFKIKTRSGVLWNLTERLGNQAVRFLLGILLARLLIPQDYGVFAITLIIISIAEVINDGGFMMVLVQRKHNSPKEYSTVFWIKIILAFLSYFIIFLLSPFFASFYGTPELENVLRVISLIMIMNALTSIQRIILTNQLDFKGNAIGILFSSILGGIGGIIAAYHGYGVWSLVIQTILIYLTQIFYFWKYVNWFPTFSWSKSFITEIRKLGIVFFTNNILTVCHQNIFIALYGKLFPIAMVGYYTRAEQFQKLPINTTNSVIVKVFFPILTENKNNLEELKKNTSILLKWLVFMIFPILILIMFNSEQIIRILLTEKWLPAKDFLIILCCAGLIIPINNTLMNVFNALGKPIISTRIYLLKIVLTVSLLIVFMPFGALWATSVIIIENIISLVVLLIAANKFIDFTLIDIKKIFLRIISANIIASLSVCFMVFITPVNINDWVHLLFTSILYVTALYISCRILKVKQMDELISTISTKVLKR